MITQIISSSPYFITYRGRIFFENVCGRLSFSEYSRGTALSIVKQKNRKGGQQLEDDYEHRDIAEQEFPDSFQGSGKLVADHLLGYSQFFGNFLCRETFLPAHFENFLLTWREFTHRNGQCLEIGVVVVGYAGFHAEIAGKGQPVFHKRVLHLPSQFLYQGVFAGCEEVCLDRTVFIESFPVEPEFNQSFVGDFFGSVGGLDIGQDKFSKILEKMTDDSRTCQKIAKFDS